MYLFIRNKNPYQYAIHPQQNSPPAIIQSLSYFLFYHIDYIIHKSVDNLFRAFSNSISDIANDGVSIQPLILFLSNQLI